MTALRLSTLAILTALAPAAAAAADLPTRKQPAPPPVVAPQADSGLYVGALAGGVFGGLTADPGASSRAAGFTTGTLLGYKWRFSPWTFGFEGDISSNWLTEKFGSVGGAPATQIDNIYAIHARARVGYQIGVFEPFVAGGFALTQIALSRQAPAEFDGAASRRPGWTIGAGVDAHFMLPVFGDTTVRAEYLYDWLSPTNLSLNNAVYRVGGAEQYARVAIIKYFNASPAPVAAPFVADWNGNYFGVIGGLNNVRLSSAVGSFDAKGGSIGIYTGRNWMFGSGMLGYEGSTSFGSVNGDGSQPLAASTHYSDYFLTDLRGRAGWAFDRWLPFVAGGVLWDTSSHFDRATGNYRGAVSQWSGTVGAGVEYMMTDRLALRGEYAYARSMGTVTTKLNSQTCCTQTRTSNTFRVGLGYFLR